jgi:hypothetical protein
MNIPASADEHTHYCMECMSACVSYFFNCTRRQGSFSAHWAPAKPLVAALDILVLRSAGLRLLATCNPRASRPTAFSRRHTSTQHIHRQSSAYFDVSVEKLRGCFNLFLHFVDENQISSTPAGILSAFRRGCIYGICVLHFSFLMCGFISRRYHEEHTHIPDLFGKNQFLRCLNEKGKFVLFFFIIWAVLQNMFACHLLSLSNIDGKGSRREFKKAAHQFFFI